MKEIETLTLKLSKSGIQLTNIADLRPTRNVAHRCGQYGGLEQIQLR